MSVIQSDRAARFRALHDGPGAFVMPNPWDVGSARILAGLGFQALATSSAASACVLGQSDHGLTQDEALAHARSIVDATDLPVSADLRKGFGDTSEAVAETVQLAAEAGLVGCTIKDSTGNQGSPLYNVRLAVERIAAAAQAARARPFPFLLTARAHNFLYAAPSLDDTISRLQVIRKSLWWLRTLPATFGLMLVIFLSSGRLSSQSAPASQPGQGMVDYDRQVHAIIADHCLTCHSSEKRSGGLSLETYDDIMAGGRTGAVVNPGRGADSLIIQHLIGAVQPQMPFGMDPLSSNDIATIRWWIDQGARATPASAAAKAKWLPPLALTAPQVPNSPWKEWSDPIDRFTAD